MPTKMKPCSTKRWKKCFPSPTSASLMSGSCPMWSPQVPLSSTSYISSRNKQHTVDINIMSRTTTVSWHLLSWESFELTLVSTAHRTKSFPASYVPPKGSKNMNKQASKESNATLTKKESTETPTSPISGVSDSDGGGYGNDTVSRPSNFSSYADYTSRDVSEDIDDEEPPALSERVATYHDDVSSQVSVPSPSADLRFYRKTRGKFSSTRAESRRDQKKTKKRSAEGKSEWIFVFRD